MAVGVIPYQAPARGDLASQLSRLLYDDISYNLRLFFGEVEIHLVDPYEEAAHSSPRSSVFSSDLDF